jgi:hypothetical protein
MAERLMTRDLAFRHINDQVEAMRANLPAGFEAALDTRIRIDAWQKTKLAEASTEWAPEGFRSWLQARNLDVVLEQKVDRLLSEVRALENGRTQTANAVQLDVDNRAQTAAIVEPTPESVEPEDELVPGAHVDTPEDEPEYSHGDEGYSY